MDDTLERRFFQTIENIRKVAINTKNIGDLSKSELMILHLIKYNKDDSKIVTTSTLSEHLSISKSAVSQMINVLENKEYVERIINKKDRRVVCISLTDLGSQMLDNVHKSIFDKLNKVLDKLGKEDTEKLIELLEKLYLIIKEDTEIF